MKRILIICNSLSGLFSFRKELIEKFIEKKHLVYISAPASEYRNFFKDLGCKIIETEVNSRGKNIYQDLKLFKMYRKIIKNIKPDVVLTYTIKPNSYAGLICSKLKVPYIANITGLGSALENAGILQKITIILYRIGLKKAKCVFVQNYDNLEFLKKYKIVKNNYKLIPGSGVNLEYHKLLPYPKNENIIFLYISRLLYEKGIEEYLEVAKYIKSKYKKTEFHILGRCEEKKYIDMVKNLQDRGIVIYHGAVEDVREFHKISNCTIQPSFYPEGMSNVLLESCASGRPIITTNRAGCKEIVEDGINGYVVECKDTDGLKEKVEKFILLSNEQKKQMGLNAREKVEQEFDRNIVINEYLKEMEI